MSTNDNPSTDESGVRVEPEKGQDTLVRARDGRWVARCADCLWHGVYSNRTAATEAGIRHMDAEHPGWDSL